MYKIFLLTFLGIYFFGCQPSSDPADIIFHNGTIIPMTGPNDVVEAIAIKDGKILATGKFNEVLRHQGLNTEMKNLEGKTLIPGFIDGHSHLMMAAQMVDMVNLSSPPVSDVNRIQDLVNKLEEKQKEDQIPDGEWILGWGYDPDLLTEKRHPDKFDLDAVFPNNPVFLLHVSGHLGVLNSLGLEKAGFNVETPDPEGGKIYRVGNTKEPNGLISETALESARHVLPVPDSTQIIQNLKTTLDYYAAHGITTANDGYTNPNQIEALAMASKIFEFPIDVIGLVGFADMEMYIGNPNFKFGSYDNRVKFAGVKIVADGSPQGKTAKMKEPYLTEVPGCAYDCKGISLVNQDQLDLIVSTLYGAGIQVFTHCNGDGAIEMYLESHQKALSSTEKASKDLRSVIIHSQFMRPDFISQYAENGLIPSYFTNHTYFWGDVHIQNMGKERAYFTSPLQASLDSDLTFTNHTDYVITPLDQPFMLWSAANRTSRSGEVIGPDQRISSYEALKALTINGAFQYFEEESKGSLEPGKLADMVVLSANPLTVEASTLKDIQVEMTIKEGVVVFGSR